MQLFTYTRLAFAAKEDCSRLYAVGEISKHDDFLVCSSLQHSYILLVERVFNELACAAYFTQLNC